MAEKVVLKLTIDDKEFNVKITADSKAVAALRKQFETTSNSAGNSISGLKTKLSGLVNKFEQTEIGSNEFKKLKVEVDKTRTAIAKAEKNIEDLEEPSKSVLEVFNQWGNVVTGLNQALEIAQKLYGVISQPINVAGEFETYEVQFEVLLGGAREAKERISELSVFAAKTPFQFPEIIRASKTLEVMTEGALATGESLRMIGDVSAGVGVPIDELSMWFGRLYDSIQSGRPAGEAMMRLQELGAMSGKARGKIEELMNTNADSKDVWKAVTKEMGRYDGMMKRQSETYEGMVSNLEDSITLLQRSVGNNLLPLAKDIVTLMGAVVESFTPMEKVITNFDIATEEASNQRNEFIRLTNQYELLAKNINKTDAEQELYKETIDDLQRLYPDYLANINLEKSSIEDVRDAFGEARLELEKYLEKMVLMGVLQDKEKELVEIGKAIWEGEKKRVEVQAAIKSAMETKTLFGVTYETDEGLQKAIELYKDSTTGFLDSVNNEMMSKKAELKRTIEKIKEEVGDIINSDDGKNGTEDEIFTNKQIKSELELYRLKKELYEISGKDYQAYLEDKVANLKSGTVEEKKILLQYQKEFEKVNKEIAAMQKDFNVAPEHLDEAIFSVQDRIDELGREAENLVKVTLSLDEGDENRREELENEVMALLAEKDRLEFVTLPYFVMQKLRMGHGAMGGSNKNENENLLRLEADAEADKYRRQERLLDIWQKKELEKWKGNEKAKANIEKIYADKKVEIAQAEAEAKMTITLQTLGAIVGMFGEHTTAYKALAVAQATWNTYQAATAALGAQPWGPWNIANAALVTAQGLITVGKIIDTESPKLPGYVKGGIVIGEKGPEIIAPMQDYAEGQAELVNKAVMAVEHKLTAIQFQNSLGDNSLLISKINDMNTNLLKYLQNPVPPIIGKNAVGKMWRDGRKMSKGYRQ